MYKKIIIILGLFCILILSSCNTKHSNIVKVGMTYEDIEALEEYDVLGYSSYYFISDGKGNSIVAKFNDETKLVEKVESYYHQKINKATFLSIKEGMTVFEVVEKVGNPKCSETSGFSTLAFFSSDGTKCTVFWDDEMKVTEVSWE